MGLNSTKAIRHGAVAVLPQDGRLLVIRRAKCVAAPGKYCFPGGGIERDESEEIALMREIREELGAIVVPVRRLWRSVTSWGVHLAWWLGQLEPGAQLVPNPAEVESIHWLTTEEMLANPSLLESNREFLAAVSTGEIQLDL